MRARARHTAGESKARTQTQLVAILAADSGDSGPAGLPSGQILTLLTPQLPSLQISRWPAAGPLLMPWSQLSEEGKETPGGPPSPTRGSPPGESQAGLVSGHSGVPEGPARAWAGLAVRGEWRGCGRGRRSVLRSLASGTCLGRASQLSRRGVCGGQFLPALGQGQAP